MKKETQCYLITGGAGFIGSHLAEVLLDRGARVTVIDDLSTGRLSNIEHLQRLPQFSLAIDNVSNLMVTDRLISECDFVFHLAAAVGVELIVRNPVHTIETNILGTHAVLKSAARYRKPVLLASTSEVYGKSTRIPFAEIDDRVLGPTSKSRWSYADSKAIDEYLGLAYYKQFGVPVIIVRLFNTVGPKQSGQYGMVIPRFIHQALDGSKISVYGNGKQSRCFCDVEDVVEALLLLTKADEAAGQVFNIGSTSEISIKDLALKILSLTGRSKDDIEYIPYEKAYEPGFEDMQRRIPNIQKITSLTGWMPKIPLDETLNHMISDWRAGRGTLA